MVANTSSPVTVAFPITAVETCLREALDLQADDQAVLRGAAQPGEEPVRSSWEPEIDSLVAVDLLCAIEELLGLELPPTCVPKGGYESAAECIEDLVTKARTAWNEQHGEQ